MSTSAGSIEISTPCTGIVPGSYVHVPSSPSHEYIAAPVGFCRAVSSSSTGPANGSVSAVSAVGPVAVGPVAVGAVGPVSTPPP